MVKMIIIYLSVNIDKVIVIKVIEEIILYNLFQLIFQIYKYMDLEILY